MACVVCGSPAPVMAHEFQIGVQRYSLRRGETLRPPTVVVAPLYFIAQPGGIEMQHPLCSAACGLRWIEARR